MKKSIKQLEKEFKIARDAADAAHPETIVVNMLADLGTSEKAAARKLAKLGIKGKIGSAQKCVLAEFLKTKFTDKVSVDGTYARVNGLEVYLPEQLRTLVERFDDSMYPSLTK